MPGRQQEEAVERRWRFYVHEDGRYASINDGVTGDTLLKITDYPGEAQGDVQKVRDFAAAYLALRSQIERELVERLKEAYDHILTVEGKLPGMDDLLQAALTTATHEGEGR